MAATNTTNLQVIEFLKKTPDPITPTELSKKMGKNYFAIRSSVEFLSKLNILRIISNGKITFVYYNPQEIQNKNLKTKYREIEI